MRVCGRVSNRLRAKKRLRVDVRDRNEQFIGLRERGEWRARVSHRSGYRLGKRARIETQLSRGVAQPGSAPALGAGGPRFESARPDHIFQRVTAVTVIAPTFTVVETVGAGSGSQSIQTIPGTWGEVLHFLHIVNSRRRLTSLEFVAAPDEAAIVSLSGSGARLR